MWYRTHQLIGRFRCCTIILMWHAYSIRLAPILQQNTPIDCDSFLNLNIVVAFIFSFYGNLPRVTPVHAIQTKWNISEWRYISLTFHFIQTNIQNGMWSWRRASFKVCSLRLVIHVIIKRNSVTNVGLPWHVQMDQYLT